MYPWAIWLAKAALLFQLIRIFTPNKTGTTYRVLHLLIWINLAFYTSLEFTFIFQCVPLDRFWYPEKPGGRCIKYGPVTLAAGSANIISDFLILILPLMSIWRLNMSSKRKIGVSAVFATGLL